MLSGDIAWKTLDGSKRRRQTAALSLGLMLKFTFLFLARDKNKKGLVFPYQVKNITSTAPFVLIISYFICKIL